MAGVVIGVGYGLLIGRCYDENRPITICLAVTCGVVWGLFWALQDRFDFVGVIRGCTLGGVGGSALIHVILVAVSDNNDYSAFIGGLLSGGMYGAATGAVFGFACACATSTARRLARELRILRAVMNEPD